MKNLAGVDHRPQPVAVFGRALHRQQQRQQLVAVRRPGVFAQRLTERHVLRAGLGGEPRGVGRHEGERLFGVAAVFRQVEMHPPDQVPGRVQRVQEALQAGAGGGERGGEGQRHLVPQRQQDRVGQILGPGHHRRRQHQGGKFACIERPAPPAGRRPSSRPDALQAQRADVAGREAAPPDEHRRQGLPDLPGAQPHQTVPAPLGKRPGQAGLHLGVDLRRVLLLLGEEVTLRCQSQSESGHPGMLPGPPASCLVRLFAPPNPIARGSEGGSPATTKTLATGKIGMLTWSPFC